MSELTKEQPSPGAPSTPPSGDSMKAQPISLQSTAKDLLQRIRSGERITVESPSFKLLERALQTDQQPPAVIHFEASQDRSNDFEFFTRLTNTSEAVSPDRTSQNWLTIYGICKGLGCVVGERYLFIVTAQPAPPID
jgi:hypothetical protein